MKLILQAIKALFRKIEASRTHWEEVKEVSVITETTVTIRDDMGWSLLPDTPQLTVGQTYFVILDGVSYECVAWYSDDVEAVIIGNGAIYGGEGGNGEPFSCGSSSDGEIYLNTEKAGIYTISISTKENIIHKLDKKYLPDQIQPDWNQNDETADDYIKNRTHYEEVLGDYVIFEGTLPSFTTTTDLPIQYAIPSDISVTAYYNGSVVATVVGYAADSSGTTWRYGFSPDLDLNVNNYTMTASVYNGMGDGVLKFVVENFTIVHTLDEKYLPINVTGMINTKMDANNPVGTGSFSMGRKPGSVVGYRSHAEGSSTTASGDYSHAEGYSTTASGESSHAEGERPTASGDYSHAEGYYTTASGESSHAEGERPTASGDYSHAEGYYTTASGESSHAEGYDTEASKNSSHAEGYSTIASGDYSHAEGYYTKASGTDSHAEGRFTTAKGNYSHAQGKYNIEDTSNKYADIIGNGTNNTTRSNAATVDWNGNAWYAGDVYTGSTSGTNRDEGSKKLATEEYVNNLVPEALPNPNALTFTGAVNAVYDGSEAVSVEIPSGGGSGVSDGMEIIADVILETDVSTLVISEDLNGQPFLLKKVVVELTSVAENRSFYPAFGNTIVFNNYTKSSFVTNNADYTADSFLYCFPYKPDTITTETYAGHLFAKWELEINEIGIMLGKGRTGVLWEDADGKFYLPNGTAGYWEANKENSFTGKVLEKNGISKVSISFYYYSLLAGSHVVIKGIRM